MVQVKSIIRYSTVYIQVTYRLSFILKMAIIIHASDKPTERSVHPKQNKNRKGSFIPISLEEKARFFFV